ncbi:hypothetical protein LRAMOSA02748 [Lichtheimia ramosa]|uniref:Uncharacterized protein n=1 Tax=Lichtheimia ramosa TaxID=688394 RepID=A0A077WR48_9FUNG|nr:hypothetical protein LRAMOSA02748 [Lichtheimia ramosa]
MAATKTNQQSATSTVAYLLTAPLGYYLWCRIAQVLAPFNNATRQQCRDPAYLASTYDAPAFLPSLLNRVGCVLVQFCSHAINEATPLTLILIGVATAAFTSMSVECARRGGGIGLALYTGILLLGGNIIGAGIMIPLLWIPVYGVCNSMYISRPIQPIRIVGITLAAVFGQCVTPILMLTVPARSMWQHNIIGAFLISPMVYTLLEICVPVIASHFTKGQKQPVSFQQSCDNLRTLWACLGTLFMLMHYILLIRYFGVWNSHWYKDPITHMLVIDISSIIGTMAYWAGIEDGFKRGTLFLLVASLVLGPGAGVAAYAWKREGRIADEQQRLLKKA